MISYLVMKIEEPDFGCEGIPQDYVVKDRVILKDKDNNEIAMQIADSVLYHKNIRVGDWVHFDLRDEIYKDE